MVYVTMSHERELIVLFYYYQKTKNFIFTLLWNFHYLHVLFQRIIYDRCCFFLNIKTLTDDRSTNLVQYFSLAEYERSGRAERGAPKIS